jgi:hypothetical protein
MSQDERKPETIDGATGRVDPTPPKARAPKLSDLRDVRLEMAYVYREVDAGRLKSQEGTRRVYMLRQIGDIITAAEIEKRISELEDHIEQQRRAGSSRPGLPYH